MKPFFHFPLLILCAAITLGLDLHLAKYSLKAHEFWIAPSTHFPSIGERVDIYAMIGHGNKAEAFARNNEHIKKLMVLDTLGERLTQGINYRLPTASFNIRSEGPQLIGYQSHEQISVLGGEKFDHYLKEEGLNNILHLREMENEREKDVRESYTRCAKSILSSKSEKMRDKWLGLPLELKVLNTSLNFIERKTLILKLHLHGKPLQGALVKAVCLNDTGETNARRTSADGTVTFECKEKARWMFNTVHMEPSVENDAVDWYSYWGSLTLEIQSTPKDTKENELASLQK